MISRLMLSNNNKHCFVLKKHKCSKSVNTFHTNSNKTGKCQKHLDKLGTDLNVEMRMAVIKNVISCWRQQAARLCHWLGIHRRTHLQFYSLGLDHGTW